MNQKNIMKYVGSMQQLAYVRPIRYTEGRSENMNAYEVKNGDLSFHVMADKCLDISELSYKGMNINFLSKPGLEGRNHYDTNGEEALRSIMGGLFFTCGLENICAPCTIEGKDYPMHGRMRTTPGEHLCSDAAWIDDQYVLTISGEMREAELFGENMVLRRTIETRFGEKSIIIRDEVENQAFQTEPMMLLYHCNMGYPFLDEACQIILPTKKVTGREDLSRAHENNYDHMEPPKDNEPEYVFIHEMAADENGDTMALVVNPTKEIGICIAYNQRNLPYFMEWKSIGSGDYVLGLEPSNSSVYGKPYHVEQNNLSMLEPFEKKELQLKFTILDGAAEIEAVKNKINQLKGEYSL